MPESGFNESKSETLQITLPNLAYHDMNAFKLPKFFLFIIVIYAYKFLLYDIVSGFNGVVAINKTELNRLRQVSSFDLQ
jgi:hypothetical protein